MVTVLRIRVVWVRVIKVRVRMVRVRVVRGRVIRLGLGLGITLNLLIYAISHYTSFSLSLLGNDKIQ